MMTNDICHLSFGCVCHITVSSMAPASLVKEGEGRTVTWLTWLSVICHHSAVLGCHPDSDNNMCHHHLDDMACLLTCQVAVIVIGVCSGGWGWLNNGYWRCCWLVVVVTQQRGDYLIVKTSHIRGEGRSWVGRV